MRSNWTLTVSVLGLGLVSTTGIFGQEHHALSLKQVPVGIPTAAIIPTGDRPDPKNIPGPKSDLDFRDLVAAGIVKNQKALIELGKAFFWDMQAGSDGVQSCGTCHFSAGADSRSKNQISPGLKDTQFDKNPSVFISGDNSFGNSTVPYTAFDPHAPVPLEIPSDPKQNPPNNPDPNLNVRGFPSFAPNYQLEAKDFPLNGWFRTTELTPRGPHTNFLEEFANVSHDTNDVISSQGVHHAGFGGIEPGQAAEKKDSDHKDETDIFNVVHPGQVEAEGLVRRVEPRNAPTVINSVFNFDNFWEGRASFIFNGVDPFGFRNRLDVLKQNNNRKLRNVYLRITNSSLASQAVGPMTSNFEMSYENRTFPDMGKKIVSLRPLAQQYVHPEDSVLGEKSRANLGAGGKWKARRA